MALNDKIQPTMESNKQPNNPNKAKIRPYKAITANRTYKRMQADEIRPYRANKAPQTAGQTDSQTALMDRQTEQTKTKHYKNALFVKKAETQKPRQTQTDTMKTPKRM